MLELGPKAQNSHDASSNSAPGAPAAYTSFTVIDPGTFAPPVRKALDPASPRPLRELLAKGAMPGVPVGDLLAGVCLLAAGDDEGLATLARATLADVPGPLRQAIPKAELHADVLFALVELAARDGAFADLWLRQPNVSDEAFVRLAELASEPIAERVAANEARLLTCPEAIGALYKNTNTRMSTADRLVELAVRNNVQILGLKAFELAAKAIAGELIAEASEEPDFEDNVFAECEQVSEDIPLGEETHELDEETGKEKLKEKHKKLAVRFEDLRVSAKVRRALVGKGADRMLAMRDGNPMVREAACKSEFLTELEVVQVTANRNSNQDVLNMLARDPEWTRNHQVKLNLVQNPRTPLTVATKFLTHLRDPELKLVAGSREVSGAIKQAAKQMLEKRAGKRG